MTDQELIDYCDKRCKSINCQFEGRTFERMFQLAGKPRKYQAVADLVPRKLYSMRDEMEALVHFAFKRMARPKGGLDIEAGRVYRDVNGDVRYVFAVVPRLESWTVIWNSTPERTASGPTTRLSEFKDWALEELKS
ncbi:hypothetical protein ACFQUU_08635 [Herbaspirillum sp. GCM10030257]|uniref:hypothetical protein n=1 Tax=Herbaspirillum sp. GCM10030257 TaxID=3273393 RepID=UPI00360DA178